MHAKPPPGGPVEWVALTFPGPKLASSVAAPLAELVRAGTVRILDAAVVHKDVDGEVTGTELEDEGVAGFDDVDGEVLELLSDDDLLRIAEQLDYDTSTLVVIWENLWATAFADAVRESGGTLLAHDRIPAADVVQALQALGSEGGGA
jgi:CBS domain-containing protein